MPASSLDDFVGLYDLGGGYTVKVWGSESGLRVREFAPDDLYPVGEDTFHCAREPWVVRFERAADGAVEAVEIQYLRRSVRGTKSPSPRYVGAAACMSNALRDARMDPAEVDYINAHGTSTPAGDVAETRAVKATFGDHAKRLVVNSTKSMTGHLLGAAGSVEAIFSILAIRDQVSPPTINLDNPGDECDLDYVANVAREMKIDVALSNSFGFGGTNGTLIFRKPD